MLIEAQINPKEKVVRYLWILVFSVLMLGSGQAMAAEMSNLEKMDIWALEAELNAAEEVIEQSALLLRQSRDQRVMAKRFAVTFRFKKAKEARILSDDLADQAESLLATVDLERLDALDQEILQRTVRGLIIRIDQELSSADAVN
ncbi:MAG: hypothetical protein Q8P90_00845 [bacterium]|nr:hypothetical protein [bacterium]